MKHLTTLGLVKIALASQLLVAPVFALEDTTTNELFNKYCLPHFAGSSLHEEADYDYMLNTLLQEPQKLYFERARNLEAINSVKVNNIELLRREVIGSFSVNIAEVLNKTPRPEKLDIAISSRSGRANATIKLTFDDKGKIIGEDNNRFVNKAISCYQEGTDERYQTFTAIYGLRQ